MNRYGRGQLAPMSDEEVAAELARLDAFIRMLQPPPRWLPSRSRSEFDALTADDVAWLDRQWRDAGGTEVTGFITTEPIAGPPLRFFVPLMVAVVVLGVVGAVVVAFVGR